MSKLVTMFLVRGNGDVDVYLLVAFMGNLLAFGASGISALANCMAHLHSLPHPRYRLRCRLRVFARAVIFTFAHFGWEILIIFLRSPYGV